MFHSSFWRRLIILAPCLLLGSLLLGGTVMARTGFTKSTTLAGGAAKEAGAQCSLATLNGRYVFAFDGVQIKGRDQVPFALAGFGIYDGSGHLHGAFSQSVNGKITSLIRYTGTYTVNSDCIVTETDTFVTGVTVHFDQFTTPDGGRFTFVETDPGFVTSGVETRGTGQRVGN